MMNFVPSLDIYVSKTDDLRGKINDDLFECVETLVNNDDDNLQYQYDCLKEEFCSYEHTLDSYTSDMFDTQTELEQMIEKIDELWDYISDAKRLNRDTLKDMLKKIDIEHAIKTLTGNL